MKSTTDRWEQFLNPEVLRPSLFLATMFITTFEILKDSVVDRIRSFYTTGIDKSGLVLEAAYQTEVVAKHKSILYASLQWLQENDVIDATDRELFEQLKSTRNLLAHQLFAAVTGQVESAHQTQVESLVDLLRKIEVWWVVNFELMVNSDFDGQEIDPSSIVPGSILSLQMLIEVASGNTNLLDQWRKAHATSRADA